MKITPILLCGGSGTRLWPLSRKSYPKQFASIVGEETLFQAAAKRMSGDYSEFSYDSPTIITNSDFRFIVAEQLQNVGVEPGKILIEPHQRNTAPAVLAAALHAFEEDPGAVLLVAPSDHIISDREAFSQAVSKGVSAVEEGRIVTFGITPSRAETGYGYLELKAKPDIHGNPIELKRFVEKPDEKLAEKMFNAGTFQWNAGIFLFRAADMVSAFENYCSELIDPVKASLREAKVDLGFLRLASGPWKQIEEISVDYAVMEKAKNLSVVPLDTAWSDLGDWDSVWRVCEPDETGVVALDRATAIDCKNTLLRSETPNLEVVGIGLENIIAIAMSDAVLVADMSCSQSVKQIVSKLEEKGIAQATAFTKDHRPWGWFESLVVGKRFQVKRIVVNPGASLSLQSHFHRSEHWIVVQGTATVTIEESVTLVTENQSVYIPLGAKHRLENPGRVPMILIEVQTGAYVGEDDIVRYDDFYARETE